MRTAIALVTVAVAAGASARADTTVIAFSTLGSGITDRPAAAVGGDGGGRGNAVLSLRAGLFTAIPTASAYHHGLYVAGVTYEPHESLGTSFLNQQLVWSSEIEATERLWTGLGVYGASGLVDDDSSPTLELQPYERPDASFTRDLNPARREFDPSGVDLGLTPTALEEAPPGLNHFYSASAFAGLSYALTPRTYFSQGAAVDTFASFIEHEHDYTTLITSGESELGYDWSDRTSLSLNADGAWEKQTESKFEPTDNPAGTGEYGRVTAGWAHYFTPGLSLNIAAGMYAARDNVTMTDFATGPAGRATLRWNIRRLGLAAQYDRGAHASLSLGGVFQRDRYLTRVRSRFGNNEMFQLRAQLVYQRLSMLQQDPLAEEHDAVEQWIGRIALGIRPFPYRQIQIDAAYRMRDQEAGVLGRKRLKDVSRHTIMISLTVGTTLTGPTEELPD